MPGTEHHTDGHGRLNDEDRALLGAIMKAMLPHWGPEERLDFIVDCLDVLFRVPEPSGG